MLSTNTLHLLQQKRVTAKLHVKKIDKTMSWYSNYCIPCDTDLQLVDKRFKCVKCGKFKPYPDRRYEHKYNMCCLKILPM